MTIVCLNVGGVYFVTRRATIEQYDFFNCLLNENSEGCELFVDRDATHFRHILNWMRGVRHLPDEDVVLQELQWEADYYCMHDLKTAITRAKRRFNVPFSMSAIREELHQMNIKLNNTKKECV